MRNVRPEPMMRHSFSSLNLLDAQLVHSRALLTACLGHLSVDLLTGMVPLILLLQKDALALSYTQEGLTSMAVSLSSSVTQPFFGWLGDHWGQGRLTMIGATVVGLAIAAMLAADRFALLLLFALITGLGSGVFHPQGAALAAQTSIERRGSAVSVFMFAGNLGFSFGPLLATSALAISGAFLPALIALLGLIIAALVSWIARSADHSVAGSTRTVAPPTPPASLSLVLTVTLVVFLRSWIQTSISTYVPQAFKEQGASTVEAGNVLFSILLPLAVGGLIGGTLSDRIGRRRVLIASTALIGPSLWGFLHTGGIAPFFIGPLLGLALGASIPVTIVMTQELAPRGLGLMSGIAMGLNFVAGAIGVWATGIVADQIGLLPALSVNAFVPVAAAVLALLLPEDRAKMKLRGKTVSPESG
jgi:FSR family fosmidomycin resistance protein-like MFS transporter